MNHKLYLFALALLLYLAFAQWATIVPAAAQSGGGYDLTWNTIDGGGGVSNGSTYSLSGTIGQPDAGTMIGGAYTLNGGFWIDLLGNKINLPLIMR